MNELQIVSLNGQLVTDSREVAEMVEKNHADLLRSIKGYVSILTESKFALSDFFIESTYQDSTGRTLLCYLLTKKGCDMVANKMTGEKGVLFTATYVTKFEEMENHIKEQQKPACIEDVLIQSLQEMKAVRQKLNEVNHRVLQVNEKTEAVQNDLQSIRDVYTLSPNGWRSGTSKLINAIANKIGGFDHIRQVREESYKLLDERAGARLNIRLSNMKKNVMVETGSKSRSEKVTKLDVIAADKKLIEVYCLIVKEMAIKYKAA
ncbi:MAG: Rha family transcriptional regulator [Clostridiaceae bacterium]